MIRLTMWEAAPYPAGWSKEPDTLFVAASAILSIYQEGTTTQAATAATREYPTEVRTAGGTWRVKETAQAVAYAVADVLGGASP